MLFNNRLYQEFFPFINGRRVDEGVKAGIFFGWVFAKILTILQKWSPVGGDMAFFLSSLCLIFG